MMRKLMLGCVLLMAFGLPALATEPASEAPGIKVASLDSPARRPACRSVAVHRPLRLLRETPPVETATTVRVQDGSTLTTDGPFADTKEVFGGYYIVEAAGLDEALEIAARVPSARLGGSVEVRPLVEN